LNPERSSQVNDSVEDSFKQCFHSFYEGLHRYAFTILQNNEEAKDVVQAVFIKLWEKRDTIKIEQAGRSYLYTAVHNQCLNVIRNNKVKNRYVDHVTKTGTVSRNEVPLEAKEINHKIMQAIELLPERCRLAFTKSRFEGKKYAEIAAEMDIAEKTVEMQIGKALKILREHLAEFITSAVIFIVQWLR
jgi:RNA polymerase sigma-70 factor (ECF subfamily)